MNITIIIPTRNRFDELKKLLLYYKKNNFNGSIFLVDSSHENNFKKTKNFLKKLNNKKIKHYRFIGRPFECTKYVSKKIKTKYVCWSGDDDYYIVKGMQDTIRILEKNNKIDAVNGLSILAKILKNKNFFSYKRFSIYENFYSSNPNPIKRLIKILNEYRVPIFSIFRSKLFIKIMKYIPSKSNRHLCPNRIIHDEYLESFLIAYFNKIFKYEFPLLIRGVPDKKYAQVSADNLIKSNQLNFEQSKSFAFVEKTISKLLKNDKDIKLFSKELKKFIKRINKKKNENYLLKLLSMQIRKLYALFFNKDFNVFFKTINWLEKS